MSKEQIRDAVAEIEDGARICVAVNPRLNRQCDLICRVLGESKDIQWLCGHIVKMTEMSTCFVPLGFCERLPITRVYNRRAASIGDRSWHKVAVYDYILHIYQEEPA